MSFIEFIEFIFQALQALQRALEIREVVTDPDGPLVAQSLHYLAEVNAHCGKLGYCMSY